MDRPWDEKVTESIIEWLFEDMPLSFSAPGGMIEFRKALAASFFFKFYLLVSSQILLDKASILTMILSI